MRTFILALCILGLAGALSAAAATAAEQCDLKKVEDAHYCDTCKAILDSDALLDKEFCKKCSEGKKGADRVKARHVQVCVKHFFACAHDGEHSSKAGKCPKCKMDMKDATDKALVKFVCEGCKKEADKEGPCSEPECKKGNKKFVKTCSKSGEFPHVKG